MAEGCREATASYGQPMRKREMRIDDVRELLASRCEEAGGQNAFARAHKMQVQYVSQVLLGHRPPSRSLYQDVAGAHGK